MRFRNRLLRHHGEIARMLGVVRCRKDGKIAYYKLDDDHIAHLLDDGFEHIEELL